MPMIATNIANTYTQKITEGLPFCLSQTNLPVGKKYQGKVRDTYDLGEQLLLITTDRLSAFDRHLATIPYKGQVLNLISAWWFEKTKSFQPNHLLSVPDPNAMVAKKCQVFPIEVIVRGYITGTTNTSLWTQYQKGARHYCGNVLPEGLRKNQPLSQPMLTPTTKETHHDRPISPADIVAEKWMTQSEWDEVSAAALRLFTFGSQIAAEHGLILVDTKYEFGRDLEGNIVIVDELHTPDSSRYWLKANYAERLAAGEEPDNIDKEFLRLWFKENCDPYSDQPLPAAPIDLVVTLAQRYIQLYEMITGQAFRFPTQLESIEERIQHAVVNHVQRSL